jgi:hypothetical protein
MPAGFGAPAGRPQHSLNLMPLWQGHGSLGRALLPMTITDALSTEASPEYHLTTRRGLTSIVTGDAFEPNALLVGPSTERSKVTEETVWGDRLSRMNAWMGRKLSPIPRMRGCIRSMPARISRRRVRMRRNRARVARMHAGIAPFRAAFDGIGGSARASRPPLGASRAPLGAMDTPLHDMGAPLRPNRAPLHAIDTPLHEMGAPLRVSRPPLRAMDTPLHEMGAPFRAMPSRECPMLVRIRSVGSRIGSMHARVKRTLERTAFPDPAPGDSPRRSSNKGE